MSVAGLGLTDEQAHNAQADNDDRVGVRRRLARPLAVARPRPHAIAAPTSRIAHLGCIA